MRKHSPQPEYRLYFWRRRDLGEYHFRLSACGYDQWGIGFYFCDQRYTDCYRVIPLYSHYFGHRLMLTCLS